MSSPFDRIDDPAHFAENRLPAHSDHHLTLYDESAGEFKQFRQSLDGWWKFHYAKNLALTIPGFEAPDFDCSGWDDIAVPGHIQLQGYDRPQYVNMQMPWDGYETTEPGQVPKRFNPVGSYVRYFTLDQPLAEGEKLSVFFHGAESAIALWLNGRYIGYATDSFTPSEFDLTEALVEGENKLAAQVVKWNSGSWLEDQDFFRFSGLFRSVELRRRPACHAEDIRLTGQLSPDFSCAEVTVEVALTSPGTVSVAIATAEADGPLCQGDGPFVTLHLDNPRLWSAEDPFLYDVVVDVRDAEGGLTESAGLKLGLRRCGIEDGVLTINGRRLVFKGVNRHEFGLAGRAMTAERTEADIKALKAIGVNAIRTSHYPNNTFLYELCDQYGLYVIDEMNLEAHAMWDAVSKGLPIEQALPGDRPEWLPTLLDRAASMVERDKNHACVLIWSCGNESFGGEDILAVSNWFKERDPARPVHYEGVVWDPRHPETSDIRSEMYTPAAEVEEWLQTHRERPFIMCEYAHAMGNSFGAVDKYLDLAYREPLFQGGFIWDFADQAVTLRDRYGVPYFGYGGDCGEAPHDAEFCGNGIFFADHSPSPKIQEVRYLYQPFRTVIGEDGFTVENRHLFTSTSAYDCVVSRSLYGQVLESAIVATDVAPGQTASYALPFQPWTAPGEYTIEVSYRLPAATTWAPAGHEVGWEQKVFEVKQPDGSSLTAFLRQRHRSLAPSPELIDGIHNIGVRGRHFTVLFSRGGLGLGLASYRYGLTSDGGRELLRATPLPNFWHALTSNERGWKAGARDGQWLLASRYATMAAGPKVVAHQDSVEVTYRYDLPTSPPSQCSVAYRVFGDGSIAVTETVEPGAGLPDMPEFGMMFVCDADLGHLTWYGEGPQECYADRRGGARLGVYEGQVASQLTPYLRPQEAGSHTGVRSATVTDETGWGLRFTCEAPGMEFSALPWTPVQIEEARHHHELAPIHQTVLRPALARRGVGGDQSWGAMTHPEYCLPAGQLLTFRFSFTGVG